jgi:hypothetical protein
MMRNKETQVLPVLFWIVALFIVHLGVMIVLTCIYIDYSSTEIGFGFLLFFGGGLILFSLINCHQCIQKLKFLPFDWR